MRIHFLLRTLDEAGGGSHHNSIAYIRSLRTNGHSVIVHVLYPDGNSFPDDISPIVHQGFGLGHLGERAYIAKLLEKYEAEADIFFLYAVELMWGGGLYRRTGGKIPVVVYMDAYLLSMRTLRQPNFGMWWYQYKRLLWDKTVGLRDACFVDQFLPCSPYIGNKYKEYGFPKEKFTLLPNIVPNVAVPHVRRKTEELTVLYIGRLTYAKGVDLAIEAMSRVKEFNAKLVIVGDGDMRADIEKRVAKSGIRVEMTGWIPESEVGTYYETADIFLHPARWPDPAPRTIVATVQYGLPVIVPDTGGSSWIVGEAGLVYTTGKLEELTAVLRRLLSSPALREILSAKGPAQAFRFEEKVVYPQFEHVLQRTVSEAGKTAGGHNI